MTHLHPAKDWIVSDTAIVAIVGDLHINSTVALCQPKVELDDGGRYRASKYQLWIWDRWNEYWDTIERLKSRMNVPVISFVNGELADNNYHATTQLITRNPADQIVNSVQTMNRLVKASDHIIVTRGTEAHVGSSGSLDEIIAKEIRAEVTSTGHHSWFHFYGEIGGVTFDMAHHPGTGHMRPWTRGGDANRLAAAIVFRYAERGLTPPDVCIRGHNHKPSDSGHNFMTFTTILPSWQMSTSFGYRLGGDWLPIGGAYMVVSNGKHRYVPMTYRWPVEEKWTLNLQKTS